MPLVSEVIQQLNETASTKPLGFPDFMTFFPVDARLSAYRDESNWALVIETLVFNPGPACHACVCTFIYCYGDDLPQAPGVDYPTLNVTADGPSGSLFDPDDVMGHRIRDSATDMRIRDKVVPITTNRAEYEAAGVIMQTPPAWVKKGIKWHKRPGLHGCELLRLIVPRYRRLFFATDNEIAERIGRKMPLLLRLDEWYHTDKENDQQPSDSESYQMIAESIAANDPTLYKPTRSPNTHWRNWPQAAII